VRLVGYLVSLFVLDVSVEPTCCDGSDELAGVCENTCAAVGKEYRKEQEAARKQRKTVRVVVALVHITF
jgi:protein kinase C substrate 80K-H